MSALIVALLVLFVTVASLLAWGVDSRDLDHPGFFGAPNDRRPRSH